MAKFYQNEITEKNRCVGCTTQPFLAINYQAYFRDLPFC